MAFQRYRGGSFHEARFALKASVVAISVLLTQGSASAMSFDTGLPDLSVDWTNTFGYTGGVRTQAQRDYITNSVAGGGNLKFGQGDINTSRFSLLSELVVKYQNNYGFRISGDGWYDPAYSSLTAEVSPFLGASGYANNRFSSYTQRYYRGPAGELLDAYAFGKFFAGEVPINVKVGRHTEYWGEAVFSNTYAVSDSQSPVDLIKGSSNPGAEIKTLFLPLNQISLQSQITPTVSVGGQYFLEWAPTRLPAGGTYFGPADMLFQGPNQFPIPGTGGFTVPRTGDLEPKNVGNFGLNVQWKVEPLQTKFGFYYRKFDDYTPWTAPQVTLNPALLAMGIVVPNGARLAYATDTQLFGVTAARDIAGASVGAEFSFRKNTALSSSGISLVNNQGASGNTLNGVLNAIWLLDKTRFYDTGTSILEFTYNHLNSVTNNVSEFNGQAYGACTNKWNGCATRDFVGVTYQFTPQWLQVFPSVDISTPLFLNYGLYGNAANNAGGFQGSLTYSAGVDFTYRGKYDLTLSYEGFYNRTHNTPAGVVANGSDALNDKGWFFVTFKAGF
ncbi:DUF1302 domain-containing protein [Paraburkholderia dinghuensis]|uniref:DUF1302 family protein n=1 Tax=Paraburkholderia dinghuensis TaxID=2305225 RepID=A0A3N6MMT1_9BURK|nr:DUF1302 family protein [Paraburkholderia dinghuensis]